MEEPATMQDEVKKDPGKKPQSKEDDIGFLESGDGVCEEEPGGQRGGKGRRYQAECRQLLIPGCGIHRRVTTFSRNTYLKVIHHSKAA
jgi:hypothetical protein